MQTIQDSRFPAFAAGIAVALVLGLTSCSGDDERSADDTSTDGAGAAPEELSSVKDIPEVTMIDEQKPWPRYTTAKITKVQPGAGGKTITVDYAGLPDQCSGFAGYAVNRTDSTAQVTVITGVQKGCTGKDTHRTTVLPLSEPLGDLAPEVSEYSAAAIPIK